jgi:hypothetical protein
MRRYFWLVIAALMFAPLLAFGASTIAMRLQGLFFVAHASSPLPALTSVGLYNLNGVMQACGGADAGTCYPMASPASAAGGSADAGAGVGSGAAAKIDTCSTGGTGTNCYTEKDIVNALKISGALKP